ncbi:polyprenyl synthetase family protein [Denitromonas ohlonensis]|jgi:farnesyl diphosphate synthase|uniref:Polyprenyl synthetase family protein n=2 Tax=Denitromonas TaxID=139331 RepID=A0A557S698_9RHOO|nr:farnesyl diphosphate synthase [Denitromonas ohlonensis]TVO59828.1 polyprenyl synthetase family protein [Denitromonas ohlonensis]TVO72939.1 polyprenyl synthetase family protein [Denitromonas ohlonensis]
MSGAIFSDWMRSIQSRTETALANALPPLDLTPDRLHEAMRYAVLGGGKRVRPLLAHGAGLVTAAAPDTVDRAACAVELIHAYSLVHDDMPCMDDDSLRRGKPTVHVEYDDATALLVGDALQSLAFQLLAEPGLLPDAARQLKMVEHLGIASGSRGMAGGQAIDLQSVGQAISREALEVMHVHKTGALIRASVQLGALCGPTQDADTLARLDQFSKRIGLLFQVVDDILDCEADTATLGKTAGKDARNDKPTYVTLLGLEEARRFAAELEADALAALSPLDARADMLRALASYIVHRRF